MWPSSHGYGGCSGFMAIMPLLFLKGLPDLSSSRVPSLVFSLPPEEEGAPLRCDGGRLLVHTCFLQPTSNASSRPKTLLVPFILFHLMCLRPGVCSLLRSNLLPASGKDSQEEAQLAHARKKGAQMVIKLITYLPDKVLLMLN